MVAIRSTKIAYERLFDKISRGKYSQATEIANNSSGLVQFLREIPGAMSGAMSGTTNNRTYNFDTILNYMIHGEEH